MSARLVAAGVAVAALTIADIVGSQLGDKGNEGVVTGRAARATWRVPEPARRRGRHRSSHTVGRIVVLAIPLSWLVSMWIAWTLVFASAPDKVISSSGQIPTSLSEKIYYVGYLLVTLGNGEYQPVGATWQWVSALASITGFAALTLGVKFIVPVVQAATTRRRTAALISLHGTTTAELRQSLGAGTLDVDAIANEIVALTEAHGAFPVLHFLAHPRRDTLGTGNDRQLALAAETLERGALLERALDSHFKIHPAIRGVRGRSAWIDGL